MTAQRKPAYPVNPPLIDRLFVVCRVSTVSRLWQLPGRLRTRIACDADMSANLSVTRLYW
jgi:hypothetical protein